MSIIDKATDGFVAWCAEDTPGARLQRTIVQGVIGVAGAAVAYYITGGWHPPSLPRSSCPFSRRFKRPSPTRARSMALSIAAASRIALSAPANSAGAFLCGASADQGWW